MVELTKAGDLAVAVETGLMAIAEALANPPQEPTVRRSLPGILRHVMFDYRPTMCGTQLYGQNGPEVLSVNWQFFPEKDLVIMAIVNNGGQRIAEWEFTLDDKLNPPQPSRGQFRTFGSHDSSGRRVK